MVIVAKSKQKTWDPQQDPNYERELRKYGKPIPSRELILQRLTEEGLPLGFEVIAELLGLDSDEDLEALDRRLKAMLRDGQLVKNRKGTFFPVDNRELLAGRVIGHADGFGFVKPDEGGEDFFLSPKEMRGLFHGDRVVVRMVGLDRRGRKEGAVVEVLERGTARVVGRLHKEGGVGFVVPDNKRFPLDIIIPRSDLGDAEEGQIVVAEIVEQPTRRTQPIGRIAEVLGDHLAPGMEIDIAIRSHDLPRDWPEAALAEAAALGDVVAEAAKADRVDLRHLPLVTIDGADARDFDDAVYCENKPKGWKLLVCIADVSAYVPVGSALDEEARKRGTSVYFPDRVIPMLPEALSNGLCSLNPQVDRLCMTCELYISRDGKVSRSKFYPAVMRSQARLTYDQVAAMLVDGDPELCEQQAGLLPHLHELYAVYQVLLAARNERGAIDFDTVETKFELDDQGRIRGIHPVVRNDAHRLIEECMLAANVAAAKLLQRKKITGPYRIHEGPSNDKLNDLRTFLREFGLSLDGGDKPQAKDYATLLQQVRQRPEAHLIQTVLLRSMSQAVYSSLNVGHFGLAFEGYTHFTSPIRRYPDLLVHRAIKHLLQDGKAEDFAYSQSQLQSMCETSSASERRADEASRDVADWLKCEYMQDKLGEVFDGIITGVNGFGLFVELTDIYVTGLVHISALDNDYYHFDPVGHRLSGERTGTVHRLGDPLRVQVAAINLDDRKIDFVPATETKAAPRRSRRRSAPHQAQAAPVKADAGPVVPAAEGGGETGARKRRKARSGSRKRSDRKPRG